MGTRHLGIEALGKASRKAALIGLLGIVFVISSLVFSSYALVVLKERRDELEEDCARLGDDRARLEKDCARLEKRRDELEEECDAKQARIAKAFRQLEDGDVAGAKDTLRPHSPTDSDVTARVYIHVWGAEQVAKIEPIADLLRRKGLSVRRADILATTHPDRSEVRYFRKDDEEEATDILNVLVSQGIRSCRLNYLGGHEDSELARPRQYEVWLASSGEPVVPPSPPPPRQLPPDLEAKSIGFETISQTESQRRVRVTGVIKNVGRGTFESAPGQQQAQLWEDMSPEPPPRPAEHASIAGLEPWSEQTNFMSFAGSLRCMIFQEWGVWLSMAEAKRTIAALLAPSPPALRPASRLVASTNFERLAPDEEIPVSCVLTWDAVSVDPGERGTTPTYRLVIWYDPSIALDANPRNDDTNAGNNMTKRSGTGVGIGSPRP